MPTAPVPDTLGDTLKIIQIAFYSVGAIIAVLTYRAAKRGLLNSVNTEYQKRVMDRLQRLSDDLYSEFDPSSEFYWCKGDTVRDAINRLNREFEEDKEQILLDGEWFVGAPETRDVQRVRRLLGPVISDPFIPDKVRSMVADFLENRLHVLVTTYIDVLKEYSDALAKGVRQPLTGPESSIGIRNQVVDQLYRKGCGVSQIEQEVQEIRWRIQDYFDSFDPHRRWWQRKKIQRRKKLK